MGYRFLVKNYQGASIVAKVHRAPRYLIALSCLYVGPILGFAVGASILQVDQTATAKHMNIAQDCIGVVAMVLMFGIPAWFLSRAWYEVRGLAVFKTADVVVVRAGWLRRIGIQAAFLQDAVLVPKPSNPKRYIACLILRDGHEVDVLLAHQHNDQEGRAKRVVDLVGIASVPVDQRPHINNEFGKYSNSAPEQSIGRVSDKDVRQRSHTAVIYWSATVPLAFIMSLRFGAHGGNVLNVALIFLALVMWLSLVRFFVVRQSPKEVIVTSTSIAARKYFSRKWLILSETAIVCVNVIQTGRQWNESQSLQINDAAGNKILIPTEWLASKLKEPLSTLLGNHASLTSSAKNVLFNPMNA